MSRYPENLIWSAALREAANQVTTDHRNADVASRAREIWRGARVGQTLTAMNIEFITALRSRFHDARDLPSKLAETAFETAWSDAWTTAKDAAR